MFLHIKKFSHSKTTTSTTTTTTATTATTNNRKGFFLPNFVFIFIFFLIVFELKQSIRIIEINQNRLHLFRFVMFSEIIIKILVISWLNEVFSYK